MANKLPPIFCPACGTSHRPRCRECQELLSKVDHVYEEDLCIACADTDLAEGLDR